MNNFFSNLKIIFTVRNVIFFGVFLRILLAIWNNSVAPTLGGSADALRFHENAVFYANTISNDSIKNGFMYSYALSFFYWAIDDSILMGSFISILAWLISCKVLVEVFKALNNDNENILFAITFYSLLPSSIFFTSITLREPFQLLLINIAIYSMLKIFGKKSFFYIPLSIACILQYTLHAGPFMFTIFLIIVAVAIDLKIKTQFKIIFSLVFITIAMLIEFPFSLSYKLNEGLVSAVNSYTFGGLSTPARTDYKVYPNLSNYFDLILFSIQSFIQYLFEPFLWNCVILKDYFFLVENILRIFFIFRSVEILIELKPWKKLFRIQLFFILSYFALEFIWSIGTMNWGTAARHHIPAYGLLIISTFTFRKYRSNSFI
jgi:hypothetical protein